MKNILNLKKVSLKPILMSLVIFSATVPVLPSYLEMHAEASSDDPWPDGDPFSSDSDNDVSVDATETTACQYPYGINPEEFDVPKFPVTMGGQPLTNVIVNPLPNGNILLQSVYGKSCGYMNFATPKETNVSETADLDDIGRLDGNNGENSFWQNVALAGLRDLKRTIKF